MIWIKIILEILIIIAGGLSENDAISSVSSKYGLALAEVKAKFSNR